jgi:hypothetical protein
MTVDELLARLKTGAGMAEGDAKESIHIDRHRG